MTRMYRVTTRRGRGECQEVRAPRTCPAVRMRRTPAPQGKSLAYLLRPSSPPLLPAPPEGAGRIQRQVVGGRGVLWKEAWPPPCTPPPT